MAEAAPLVVPLASQEDAHALAGLWVPFARATAAPVRFVHVLNPLDTWDGTREQAEQWLTEARHLAERHGVTAQGEVVVGYSVAESLREVIRRETPTLLLLRWKSAPRRGRRDHLSEVLDALLDNPPCDVLVIRGQVPLPGPRRLLIPTAGGPNARLAARVAHAIAQAQNGEAVLLYIYRPNEPPPSDERLAALAGDLAPDPHVRVEALQAAAVVPGILTAAANYDVLLVGATEESLWRRVLVGDVPRRLAAECPIPLGIAKRQAPRARTWARQALTWVDKRLPKLPPAERADLYRRLRDSTRGRWDFHFRMGLAAIIAALGLLLNSPAVIIGAMLVAPMMSAVLALGLGIVTGDGRLVRRALLRVLQGMALALGLSLVVAWAIPFSRLTPEILSRSRPTLLDLVVALASGLAGGYAISRKDVQEALPGVAIAVALLPPLSAAGIAIAQAAWPVMRGALLLYLTNMVAIAAAGGLVFLLLGFRPHLWSRTRMRVFWQGVLGLILLLLFILLPLIAVTRQDIRRAEEEARLHAALQEVIAALDGMTLLEYTWEEREGHVIYVTVDVQTERPLSRSDVTALQEALAARLGRPVGLRVRMEPTIDVPPNTGERR